MIPQGASPINGLVCVWREEEQWTYFLGTYPIYTHRASDHRMFRLFTSQLINCGACRNVDIINTFGVSKSSVARSLRKLREEGAAAFFKARKRRTGGAVFTGEVLDQAQDYLNREYSRRDTAEALGVRYDTFCKAINDGRLREPEVQERSTSKSSRDQIDTKAAEGIGTACTRVGERVLAAFGVCEGAPVRFESCLDVPNGGVLCALPSLLVGGLIWSSKKRHRVKRLLPIIFSVLHIDLDFRSPGKNEGGGCCKTSQYNPLHRFWLHLLWHIAYRLFFPFSGFGKNFPPEHYPSNCLFGS